MSRMLILSGWDDADARMWVVCRLKNGFKDPREVTILIHPAGIDRETGALDKESLMRVRKGFHEYQTYIKKGIFVYFVSSVKDRLGEGYKSQSEMMRDTLVSWGVSKENIFVSNESDNTLDDINNSLKLVKVNNLPEYILNVSSWYHILRIALMWLVLRKRHSSFRVRFSCAGTNNYLWMILEPAKIIRFLFFQRKRINNSR